MEIDADRIMPELAATVTGNAGVPWLAGLLLAAPFAAVMSSVDSFLLMVSSSVVRDIYQNRINPDAKEERLKKLSYLVTVVVGMLAMLAALNPPEYLQDLIIFATSGLAGCFLMPILICLYWPGMTAQGAIAGLLGGLGSLVPEKKDLIARFGIKAVAAGSLSNLMSAALAGLLLPL